MLQYTLHHSLNLFTVYEISLMCRKPRISSVTGTKILETNKILIIKWRVQFPGCHVQDGLLHVLQLKYGMASIMSVGVNQV